MDDIYGFRARLGLIYPSPSYIMEPEFYLMSPVGVITCTTRVELKSIEVGSLERMGDDIVKCTKLLCDSRLDAIILGCTSGSFLHGPEYEDELIKRMQEAADGVPCTTTSTAIANALRKLQVKKISVVTPYTNEINDLAKQYLEKCGLEVCSIHGLRLVYDKDINSRPLELNYRYAKSCLDDDSDAIVILCTALRTVPFIEYLEKDIGKPVVTAVASSFWHVLRLAGVYEAIDGFGTLLRK